jgi:hypothetical protein
MRRGTPTAGTCFLVEDNWDDYNFKALFERVVTDTRGQRHEVGTVKIMKSG